MQEVLDALMDLPHNVLPMIAWTLSNILNSLSKKTDETGNFSLETLQSQLFVLKVLSVNLTACLCPLSFIACSVLSTRTTPSHTSSLTPGFTSSSSLSQPQAPPLPHLPFSPVHTHTLKYKKMHQSLVKSHIAVSSLITDYSGRIIFSILISNWGMMFERLRSKIRVLANKTDEEVKSNLTDLQLLKYIIFDRNRLIQVLNELSSFLVNIAHEAQLSITVPLCSAIWNWIECHPNKFNETICTHGKFEGAPEHVLELFFVKVRVGSDEKVIWLTLTALCCMISEKMAKDFIQFSRRGYKVARKDLKFLDEVLKQVSCPRVLKHWEVGLVAAVDLCHAAIMLNSISQKLSGRSSVWEADEIDIVLYANIFVTVYRFLAPEELVPLIKEWLEPIHSDAVKICTVHACLSLAQEVRHSPNALMKSSKCSVTFIAILKLILESQRYQEEKMSFDMSLMLLLLTNMVSQCVGPQTYRLRMKFCGLCDSVTSNTETCVLRKELLVRGNIIELLMEWMEISLQEVNRDREVNKFNVACLKTFVTVLDKFQLRFTDALNAGDDMIHVISREFNKYSHMLLQFLEVYQPEHGVMIGVVTDFNGPKLALALTIVEVCPFSKDDMMISVMLNILDSCVPLTNFLKALIDYEIASATTESSLFHCNSVGNKFLSSFTKTHGYNYLRGLIGLLIMFMKELPVGYSYEMDPLKAKEQDLVENQKMVEMIREISAYILHRVVEIWPMAKFLVMGAFIFLRFITPAIVSPEMVDIKLPIENGMMIHQGLMLIGKILQNLVNNIFFGKEVHMTPLNRFLEGQIANVTQFLSEIHKSPPSAFESNDPWQGMISDNTDAIVLHQFLDRHADKIGKELLSMTKLMADGNPLALNGKCSWDELCVLLIDLGTPVGTPELSMATSQDLIGYHELMAQYVEQSMTSVQEFFVETPPNDQVYWHRVLSSLGLELNDDIGTVFCSSIKTYVSVAHILEELLDTVAEALLEPNVLEQELYNKFQDVTWKQFNSMHIPVTLHVASSHIHITSHQRQPVSPVLACRNVEIIHLADIGDIYNIFTGQDMNAFIVQCWQDSMTYFFSALCDPIVKAIQHAKGKLKNAHIYISEWFSQFLNVPTTLLHIGFLSVDLEDETMQSAAYHLLGAVCTYLKYNKSPILAVQGFLNIWQARWMSLVTFTAFQNIPAIQRHFFVALVALANQDVDDDFLYQILVAFHAALVQADENYSNTVVSMLQCICQIIPILQKNSRYISSIFWLAVSLLQSSYSAFYVEAMILLQTLLESMEEQGMFHDQPIEEVLLEGQSMLKEIMEQLNHLLKLSFKSSFLFTLTAVIFKEMHVCHLKKYAEAALKTLLQVTVKSERDPDATKAMRSSFSNSVLSYFLALLPTAMTLDTYCNLIHECDIGEA
ncbi:Neurofibromin [Leucoagaricus sp. SymC.cos]|nr:Neurofibromin [Leucoagaricus sp. SymC.cos]